MLVLTLMRWMSLPIPPQFYIWMDADNLKSNIVTYIELISVLCFY